MGVYEMNRVEIIGILGIACVVGSAIFFIGARDSSEEAPLSTKRILLPDPTYEGERSLEYALYERRSVRNYTNEPLTIVEISQLLWAAQGTTDERGFRTAPSAGALYPLELYLVMGDVKETTSGIYRYLPDTHALEKVLDGDLRSALSDAAFNQSCIENGAVVVIFSAVYGRTTEKYGDRGIRYIHMEAGHAAQNVYLQAVALDLGTTVIGAFDDDEVKNIVGMEDDEEPLYLMPVGKKAE